MKLFKRKDKDVIFCSPVNGELIPLNEVNDDAFASGLLGIGFAIIPTSDVLYSPFDGEVVMVFPTKHAIGLRDKNGNEYLFHIGINTVNLNGEGFESFVSVGQKVRKGEKLIQFPLESLINQHFDPVIMIVLTNKEDTKFGLNEYKTIRAHDELLKI